jgi:hypothetical protein
LNSRNGRDSIPINRDIEILEKKNATSDKTLGLVSTTAPPHRKI